MSLDGLWTEELYGLFGWENRGVLVLEDGRIMGGGNNHFVVGTYTLKRKKVQMKLSVEYHGTPRTEFGSKERRFTVDLEGTLKDDRIKAQARRPDHPDVTLAIRLTRRADLP